MKKRKRGEPRWRELAALCLWSVVIVTIIFSSLAVTVGLLDADLMSIAFGLWLMLVAIFLVLMILALNLPPFDERSNT